jgi:RNA polymerase sigma-70 factor (ECF subfamily)
MDKSPLLAQSAAGHDDSWHKAGQLRAISGLTNEVSDEQLVERLRTGHVQAGEALCKRHAGSLIGYLRKMTQSPHIAEELHQQAWVSVLENIDRFDPKGGTGSFKSWLYRIATNKANDQWRSRGRQKVAYAGLRLVTESDSPDSQQAMSDTEEVLKLRAAIEQLPEAQRQVVQMRYYGNLKFSEIAEVLGCPMNTALGRMHKATLRLRQLMQ